MFSLRRCSDKMCACRLDEDDVDEMVVGVVSSIVGDCETCVNMPG